MILGLARIWKEENDDIWRIPAYRLAMVVKELRIRVEQGRIVTTLNMIKH